MGLGGSQITVPGGGNEAFQVVHVTKGSPGDKAGFEALFDFIISINGIRMNKDDQRFKEMIQLNANKSLDLLVYSSKSQSVRQITLIPNEQGLLGLSIRFHHFDRANEHVWHILDIQPHSPAALAGLRANTDYIIGSENLLSDPEDFFSLIESYQGTPLKFYVYNSERDSTREVILTPNRQWGGEGSLGCGIGYGYLHRIPLRTLPSTPVTKAHPALLNIDSIAPPKMNFTFQPANLPPLTITMPRLIFPVQGTENFLSTK